MNELYMGIDFGREAAQPCVTWVHEVNQKIIHSRMRFFFKMKTLHKDEQRILTTRSRKYYMKFVRRWQKRSSMVRGRSEALWFD